MTVFLSTLNQMAELFLYIFLGYIIAKAGVVKKDAATVLSKLENNIFIPALIFGTFMSEFTPSKLQSAWKILLFSSVSVLVAIPVAMLIAKIASKDRYIKNIYTYGLCFSNFGFMGNAVVNALFPEFFADYLIFSLPLWVFIYMWGVPALLMEDTEQTADGKSKRSILKSLKTLVNPMFISMIVGALFGLFGIGLPSFADKVVSVCGGCMSPIAMILTGITFSVISFKKVFTSISIYFVSFCRLVFIPFMFAFILFVLSFAADIPELYRVLLISSVSMPLGLNTIVIPAAYGRDTTVAAGMALISHLLSVITIPIIFAILL